MSKPSLELRWFFKGLVPAEVRSWFTHTVLADRPCKEKSRRDLYFLVRNRDDLGLKLSRGRLELKWCQAAHPFALSDPRVDGVAENWVKEEWRGAKELGSCLDLAFGKPNLRGWRVEVHKTRCQRKFQVDARGHLSDLVMDRPAEQFFKVELTSLAKHDRPWWTLGMEISGEPENLQEIFAAAVQNLLSDHPPLNLHAGQSYGYPRWLMHSL